MINNSKIEKTTIQIIKELKAAITIVGMVRLQKKLKMSRSTIHFHLNEERAEKTNISALNKISKAIDALRAKDLEKANKLNRKIKSK